MSSEKTILIPIDRYRVDYEIGYGTPFSSFDLIVLGAIAEDQGRGIAALARILCLPQRVLVESIVSLTRLGWVAVGRSDKEFEVTNPAISPIGPYNHWSTSANSIDSKRSPLPPVTARRFCRHS